MIKSIMAAVTAATLCVPALADPVVKGWKTNDSMGCMMMRECTNDVNIITSVEQLQEYFPDVEFTEVKEETQGIITELSKMGVGVYLANDRYFPRGHAGVYYTVGNNFFLNITYATDPNMMIRTLRHEAWHAAQDAMAGTINNNNIAIIYPEESVPREYVVSTDVAYANRPSSIPWEREAKWAGGTPNMTLNVLRIINETNNKPWTKIEPTPMTREWLENKGYM